MKKQAAIDWPLVLKMFAGGALTGAGLGAGSSFLRYLQSLKDQTTPDSSADDDVLYLNLPEKPVKPGKSPRTKMASTATYATGGMAGILGTILAYNAVRNAYQKHRKKLLQEELDKKQQIYLGDLTTQRDFAKGASQFSGLSKGVGTAYLALLLAALGSGVVANRMLQKQFPPAKNPNRQRPRKIVVRSKTPQGEEDRTITSNQAVTPDALEGLVRTDMALPKVANADCSIADLIGAVAAGRGDEVLQNAMEFGLDSALDLVKGARHEKVSHLDHNMAITWLCTQPFMAEAIQPLVAAEFQDGGGEWYLKAASFIPEEYHDNLVGLLEAGTHEARKAFYAPLFEGKKVAMDLGSGMLESALLSKSLGSILGNKQPGQDSESGLEQAQEGRQVRQPGGTDTPISQDSTPPDIELSDDEAKRFWEQYGPSIDSAVAKA